MRNRQKSNQDCHPRTGRQIQFTKGKKNQLEKRLRRQRIEPTSALLKKPASIPQDSTYKCILYLVWALHIKFDGWYVSMTLWNGKKSYLVLDITYMLCCIEVSTVLTNHYLTTIPLYMYVIFQLQACYRKQDSVKLDHSVRPYSSFEACCYSIKRKSPVYKCRYYLFYLCMLKISDTIAVSLNLCCH